MLSICEATLPDQIHEVRKLMRAFVEWHRVRHHTDSELLDSYFDPVKYEAELKGLPGKFASPQGRLLLASFDGRVAGCVALHDLGVDTCEMKRMFVYPEFHGKGIGRALVESSINEAKKIGYTMMRLDTGAKQIEAQGLYHSVGFHDIPAYYEMPDSMRDWLVFMELELQ